jgi:hypothetical protein
MLALPNFKQPFIFAYGIGIGVVMHQDGHSIAYFSKKLARRTQKESTYFREMLAITEVIANLDINYLAVHL